MHETDREIKILNKKRNQIHKDNDWHIDGVKIKDEKILALGRSCFYLNFIKKLAKKLNKTVYQSDFMTWKPSKNAKENLSYYIDTAEEIHFSIRGISKEDIEEALDSEEQLIFMTSWEMRYIFKNKNLLDKTIWYAENNDMAKRLKSKGIKNISLFSSGSPELKEKQIIENGKKYYNRIVSEKIQAERTNGKTYKTKNKIIRILYNLKRTENKKRYSNGQLKAEAFGEKIVMYHENGNIKYEINHYGNKYYQSESYDENGELIDDKNREIKYDNPFGEFGRYIEWNTGGKTFPIKAIFYHSQSGKSIYDSFFCVLNCGCERILDRHNIKHAFSDSEFKITNIDTIPSWSKYTNDNNCVLDLYCMRAEVDSVSDSEIKKIKSSKGYLIYRDYSQLEKWEIPEPKNKV
ncbi:MAG: hypothetical protein JEY96_19085 [Bacteroidales bacterium]|nr:hypothetical protein [Bacteroidales bacterium]